MQAADIKNRFMSVNNLGDGLGADRFSGAVFGSIFLTLHGSVSGCLQAGHRTRSPAFDSGNRKPREHSGQTCRGLTIDLWIRRDEAGDQSGRKRY